MYPSATRVDMARATTTRPFRDGDTAWFNSFLQRNFSGRHTIGGGLFGLSVAVVCQPIIGDRDANPRIDCSGRRGHG
jgi:hypothetical protein